MSKRTQSRRYATRYLYLALSGIVLLAMRSIGTADVPPAYPSAAGESSPEPANSAAPAQPAALTVTSVFSRYQHSAPTFDLDVTNPAYAIECRGQGAARLLVTFSEPIQLTTATPADVTLSFGTVTGLTVAGKTLDLSLTGTAGPGTLIVEFPGVRDQATGQQTVGGSICVRVLVGDVDTTGTVNIFDLLAVRAKLNQPVTLSTFLMDVVVNGSINIFDLLAVRQSLSQTVGPCPN